jgi:hypothetical protein
MSGSPNSKLHVDEESVASTALVLCRAVYRATGERQNCWQPIWDVVKRFDLTASEAQGAFKYAVAQRWIEAAGNPIFSVQLIEHDIQMLANQTPAPLKRKHRSHPAIIKQARQAPAAGSKS